MRPGELAGAGAVRNDSTEDIDRATRALYDELRTTSRHAAFIRSIESEPPPELAGPPPRVVVMPGAFHRQYAHTGADGRRVLELAAELGWAAETVPVPSFAAVAENAAALVEFLAARRDRPVILVSLSKGGADVRAAMERPDAAAELRDVRAWVNISGIVTGTPLVAWLRARPLRCLGVRALLWLRGQRFAQLEELSRADGAPLRRPMSLPPGVRAIHVVGFPLAKDLMHPWSHRAHARLRPLGPNDGGGILLRDVLDLPGDVYPVFGADHYLTPRWDIRPLLLRLLREAGRPAAEAARAQVRST